MKGIPMQKFVETLVLLIAVIDPIGTIPVFIAVTKRHQSWEKRRIALQAVGISATVLLGFIIAGQYLLDAINVPLSAFQISGGIILFLFSMSMIFGDSKPDQELKAMAYNPDTTIFPLAIPSIASPGAMMAVVLLTDNRRFSILDQVQTTMAMLLTLIVTLLLLLLAGRIHHWIGNAGASIISRVMGLVLAAVATNAVLDGIRSYFAL